MQTPTYLLILNVFPGKYKTGVVSVFVGNHLIRLQYHVKAEALPGFSVLGGQNPGREGYCDALYFTH